MPHSDSEDLHAVALYWDFENIHAGLCNEKEPGSYANKDNRFKPQEPLVDVQAVVDMAASFGPIAINRAYCNWQYFGRYRHLMLQNAVELLQLFPPGDNAKNGADIKLCLDAAEDIARFPHIGTVIIVGGDSDFMPVSHKIKAAGRTLIGVGLRKTTNKNWASSCHRFRYYESLAQAPGDAAAPSDLPADLLRRAVRLLGEQRGEEWVDQGAVWPLIKRLDPTFDLQEHGHSSFPAMVKSLGGLVEVHKGTNDQLIRLR